MRRSAHGFLIDAREIDKQHDFQGGVGEVVESCIAPR
ncbi:XkdF-like putative serine protease domain-containing protein [Bacteroides uniformis]